MYLCGQTTKDIPKIRRKSITKKDLFKNINQAGLNVYSYAVTINNTKPMNYTGSLAFFTLVNNSMK